MPVVSDYVVISAGGPSRVGPEPATFRFRTGGRYRGSDAVLMVEVIGLNGFFEPEIQVNGQAVGHLRPNRGANENWMWTQMVVFRADILESGLPNTLTLSPAREADGYAVGTVICHFPQEA